LHSSAPKATACETNVLLRLQKKVREQAAELDALQRRAVAAEALLARPFRNGDSRLAHALDDARLRSLAAPAVSIRDWPWARHWAAFVNNALAEMRLAAMALLLRVCASLPDVVFIVADDLGFNDMGFHGSRNVQTPHLNALARDGVDLLHYHTLPVCSPSRAMMLSGFHAIHHGIYTPFEQGSSTHLASSTSFCRRF